MSCILELHFFFSFNSSKGSFVFFSSNKIIFILVDTARWEAQNDSGVCAYFLCWKEISFSNKLREFIWLFSRNTKMIYGNTAVVEMVISRWLTVSSNQVNFLQLQTDPQWYFLHDLYSQGRFSTVVWTSPGNIAHSGLVFLRSPEWKIWKSYE